MGSVEYYSGPRSAPIRGIEAASQTYDAGDLVDIDTAGHVIIATAGHIAGIATKDATGTTSAVAEYEPINYEAIYVAKYHTDATSQTLVGDCLDFTFTIGGHTLDEDSAGTDVYCVALDPRDGAIASGRLLVKFYATLATAPAT